MPRIEVSTERELNDAAWAGVVLRCTDPLSGEADQCAGVVINAIVDWRNA
ncbi:MAG TPA: hypothetical protein PKV98_04400 [Burkholderiaceae bacterium]|nr:hypothetical protein [Burkholderiaceae bacterium]